MTKIKVALDTLGCKVNQAEVEALARQFASAGYEVVSPADKADVYILNTCTVTHIADRKSRHWFRLAHRRNPDAILVATGCYAERAGNDVAQLEGVHLVVPNSQKKDMVKLLEASGLVNRRNGSEGVIAEIASRTRAFIKVQDGCSNYCAYCIVPVVRGNETSVPPDEIINEVRQREAEGYKEIVITGVKIGAYRYNGMDLKEIIERVLVETEVPRLRLSSLQPQEIRPGLIRLWQNPRLCSHFHLSLQSGSDSVLARMKRRYTTAEYEQAVLLIRSVVPDAAITTDIIAGFPGETETEFEESYRFCQKMDFSRIHVFPYSPRRGTLAVGMPGHVPDKIKKERAAKMLTLAEECITAFSRKFLGKTMPVLFEQQSGCFWTGLTGNYIKVYLESNADLTNQIVEVKLGEVWGEGVKGVEQYG